MSKNPTAISHRLKSLSIIGGFLDGQTFEFADGLNCIIGARGTGKTTILEFVRYALGEIPGDSVEARRIEALVGRNLEGAAFSSASRRRTDCPMSSIVPSAKSLWS